MNSSNRRDQIKLLSGAIRNALECVENECDQLQTLTDGAVSTTGDLKNHRIKAENDKKRFQADLRQAYRALYSEYARTRKLLYSKAWFSNGLDEMDRAVQETALQSYHDQTHPFCSLEVRENVPSILMPVHSSVTIADTALLGRDETETQIADLYKNTKGFSVSLLQMAPDIQQQISDTGSWPDDGLGTAESIPISMISHVLQYRDDLYRMNRVKDKLLEFNGHMMTAPSVETLGSAPNDQNSIPSTASTASNAGNSAVLVMGEASSVQVSNATSTGSSA